jgi:hypothetical protein
LVRPPQSSTNGPQHHGVLMGRPVMTCGHTTRASRMPLCTERERAVPQVG